jgi:chemotaxis protein MotB
LTAEGSRLQSQIELLNASHDQAAGAWAAQLKARESEVQQLAARVEQLAFQVSAAEQRDELQKAVVRDKAACEAARAELQDHLRGREAELTETRSALQASADAGRQAQIRISELQAELNALNEEKGALQKAVREEESGRQAALGRAEELAAELARSRSGQSGLEQRLSVIKAQERQTRETVAELKASHDAMVNELKQEMTSKEIVIEHFAEKLTISFVDRILFESGKADITPEGQAVLTKVAHALKQVHSKSIRVEGHTDNKLIRAEHWDRFRSNWELSAARAAAVVRYLQEEGGLDPAGMEAVGHAFYKPLADNDTAEGRALNRRVNIVIAPRLN